MWTSDAKELNALVKEKKIVRIEFSEFMMSVTQTIHFEDGTTVSMGTEGSVEIKGPDIQED